MPWTRWLATDPLGWHGGRWAMGDGRAADAGQLSRLAAECNLGTSAPSSRLRGRPREGACRWRGAIAGPNPIAAWVSVKTAVYSADARIRNRPHQAMERPCGADRRPGRAAARREHRHRGARHGEFRADPAAAGAAARRLAQHPCPPRRVGRRRGAGRRRAVRHPGGRDRRLQLRAGDDGARP